MGFIVLGVLVGAVVAYLVISRNNKAPAQIPPPGRVNNEEATCYAVADTRIEESKRKSSREFIYEAHYRDEDGIPPGSIPGESAKKATVFFEVGDYAGNEIELGRDGLVIGRDPGKANLILHSTQVSGSHVHIHVLPEGGVMVEDLNSLNGTFFLRPDTIEHISWEPIKGKKILNQPMGGSLGRIKIGEDIAVLEIRWQSSGG